MVDALCPPETNTLPDDRTVAVKSSRGEVREAVATNPAAIAVPHAVKVSNATVPTVIRLTKSRINKSFTISNPL